jgi:hypothetical protein
MARRSMPPLALELLESRHAPSVTIVNPTTAAFTDVDGDLATIKVSQGTLTAGVFTTRAQGLGDQLEQVDLSGGGFDEAGLTVTAKKRATGDGFVNVGFIDSTGHDLGAVAVAGDLGRINAGAADTTIPAVLSLHVRSLGRYGLDTQAGGGSPESLIAGRLGKLAVDGDVAGAFVLVTGGTFATIGSVSIGGSLVGGANANLGSITGAGDIGPVRIGHDIVGGAGDNTGEVFSGGNLAGVTVGGSLVGGGGQDSGEIVGSGDVGPVRVGHDVVGGGGPTSGLILSHKTLASATVGGSLAGGAGPNSGSIICNGGEVGPVRVGHDVVGGEGFTSGIINGVALSGVTIGGSLVGGAGGFSGLIATSKDMGPVRVGQDLVGGSISGTTGSLGDSGGILSLGRIASVFIGGSVISGSDTSTGGDLSANATIRAGRDLGSLTVRGGLIGNSNPNGDSPVVISARGQKVPGATTDIAIGRITIGGRAEHARFLAGYDTGLTPKNADAQVRAVTVGGDWIASDLVAGVAAGADGLFGRADDAAISGAGTTDNPGIVSSIAGLKIGGLVYGTPFSVSGSDHFGFVAQEVGSVKVGGFTAPLRPGADNDVIELAPTTGDMTVREVA